MNRGGPLHGRVAHRPKIKRSFSKIQPTFTASYCFQECVKYNWFFFFQRWIEKFLSENEKKTTKQLMDWFSSTSSMHDPLDREPLHILAHHRQLFISILFPCVDIQLALKRLCPTRLRLCPFNVSRDWKSIAPFIIDVEQRYIYRYRNELYERRDRRRRLPRPGKTSPCVCLIEWRSFSRKKNHDSPFWLTINSLRIYPLKIQCKCLDNNAIRRI